MNNRVGVVILNYNDATTTSKLVDEIKGYSSIYKIVIVDNCSTDSSYYALNSTYNADEKVDVILSKSNGGYGAGNNLGIEYLAKRYGIKYQIICNPDVHFEENTIQLLLHNINALDRAAIVAPTMYDRNNRMETKCVWRIPSVWEYTAFSMTILSRFTKSFYYDKEQFQKKEPWEVGCVAGSMFMIDLAKFNNTKIFDEKIFLYCEETMLGIKIKELQMKAYIIPNAKFQHLHSVSITKSIPKEIERSKLMWKSRLYVINTYMKPSIFERIMAVVCMYISQIERRIKLVIKQ